MSLSHWKFGHGCSIHSNNTFSLPASMTHVTNETLVMNENMENIMKNCCMYSSYISCSQLQNYVIIASLAPLCTPYVKIIDITQATPSHHCTSHVTLVISDCTILVSLQQCVKLGLPRPTINSYVRLKRRESTFYPATYSSFRINL